MVFPTHSLHPQLTVKQGASVKVMGKVSCPQPSCPGSACKRQTITAASLLFFYSISLADIPFRRGAGYWLRERGKWEQRETRALRAKTDRIERQEKSTKLMSGRNLKKKVAEQERKTLRSSQPLTTSVCAGHSKWPVIPKPHHPACYK